MEQRDLLKRYLDAGMAFTTMTRARAEAIVKELARAGEVQREQVQAQVDDLVQRSRHNTEQLRTLVRKEVGAQFLGLGLATKRDLSALERRLTERFGGGSRSTPSKRAPAKDGEAGNAAAEKAAARKAAAKKAAATRAAKKAAAEHGPGSGTGRGGSSISQVPGNGMQGNEVRPDEPPASGQPVNRAPGDEAQPPQVSDS